MSANQRVILTNEEDDILDPEKSLAGKSRIGNITITRNVDNYMIKLEIVEGTTTRTITLTRDENNYLTNITEVVT